MAGDNETEKFVVDRSTQKNKDDAPGEIILNSGETMQVREHDPAVFGRERIVEETKERQEAVNAQKDEKPETPEKEVKVEEQPQVSEESREKFTKFIGEIEKQVTLYAAESLRREAPYLTGDLTTDEYLQLGVQRKRFRDELEEQINERARGLQLSGPMVNDIKQYLDTNLSSSQIITPEERLQSLWGALRPVLFPFVDAYDELRKRYQAERAIVTNVQQEKALKASLQDALQQKKYAFESMKTRIKNKSGLTEAEKNTLIRLATNVARPEEKIQRKEDEVNTIPPGLEKITEIQKDRIDTLPVIVPKPPVPADETPPITPPPDITIPPAMSYEDAHTPTVTPPPTEHIPMKLETKQEAYERTVSMLYRDVIEFEYKLNKAEQNGVLSDEAKRIFRNRLQEFPEKLLKLDEDAEDTDHSALRKELVKFLVKLRERLPHPIKKRQADTVSVLNDVRTMHRHVLATYTSVQHELSVDQRRDMRSRIARFASLVRNTELEHHISRATEHAPLIVQGALAPEKE